MEEAQIPVEYWFLKMEDFQGPNKLKTFVDDYMSHIKENYTNGKSVCFVGGHGIGKTYSVCCILRKALRTGLSAYYVSAGDLINNVVNDSQMRNKMKEVDFLVIDELDSRFFTSSAQKELFGSMYENIFRNRCQNKFPTIMCSNETNNLLKVFGEQRTQSIISLHTQYLQFLYVAGLDFRKNK
jgi:DNA replication protein DnaC